ncbi:PIN domain-containing protein [Tsukamurella sp. M9C]|uniref:PIN domain-containing protein n=1 Tax=Tsukamurella sp. M9C TaxID=2877520 RepID=UPI001CCECDC0|nr:PIN domain-containing protein [Tsukamurella sp. M9C]MCA0158256.1 PIN domain-containing protein [Tsukamurella sp. M9C]
MTFYYLDTSVAIHALLRTPGALEWFDAVSADPESTIISSRILQTELTRYLRRESAEVAARSQILDHVSAIPLSEAILTSAESIAEHVRAIDAIHLASAMVGGSRTVVVTHDARMRTVAEANGLTVLDPVA